MTGGTPIVTAADMRASEARAIAAGTPAETLMERAGSAVGEAAWRFGGGRDVLILCGPGNNGGDGYVAARWLRERGGRVRVAASGPARGDPASAAAARWNGPVETLEEARPARIVIDALFGTGLSRALDETVARPLRRLVDAADLSIAVDLPSGLASDEGGLLGAVPDVDITLALGALKPAHILHPATGHCGQVRLIDIGIAVESATRILEPPVLTSPTAADHKYSRGMVVVVAGVMPGAAQLAARAAFGAGAGYVLLLGDGVGDSPAAIVRSPYSNDALDDARIGGVVVGPGLGRDGAARERIDHALASDRPLVIDGDALRLIDPDRLAERDAPSVLTPHQGEFDALFGTGSGNAIERAGAAAAQCRAIVVLKGATTLIAAPDGRVAVSAGGSPWLSTAGTGDVLAGAIAAMLARTPDRPLEAAGAGVWLHKQAARALAGPFIADDLAAALGRGWRAQ